MGKGAILGMQAALRRGPMVLCRTDRANAKALRAGLVRQSSPAVLRRWARGLKFIDLRLSRGGGGRAKRFGRVAARRGLAG